MDKNDKDILYIALSKDKHQQVFATPKLPVSALTINKATSGATGTGKHPSKP